MKNKSLWSFLGPVVVGSLLSTSLLALSPPWYVFQGEMTASIGADACVKVKDLNVNTTPYGLEVQVTCSKSGKATGLATLLTRTVPFGNVSVNVYVTDASGQTVKPVAFPSDTAAAMKFVNQALTGNQYYMGNVSGNAYYTFFLEFKKQVVSYFADNVADKYSDINKVAADSFREMIDFASFTKTLIGTTTNQGPAKRG